MHDATTLTNAKFMNGTQEDLLERTMLSEPRVLNQTSFREAFNANISTVPFLCVYNLNARNQSTRRQKKSNRPLHPLFLYAQGRTGRHSPNDAKLCIWRRNSRAVTPNYEYERITSPWYNSDSALYLMYLHNNSRSTVCRSTVCCSHTHIKNGKQALFHLCSLAGEFTWRSMRGARYDI